MWRSDGQTYTTRLIVAFRNFSKTPKKRLLASSCPSVLPSMYMGQLESQWTYLHEILHLRISDKSCKENQNTHFLYSNFLPKILPFMTTVKQIWQCQTGHRWQHNMGQKTWHNKDTLCIYNTYCFSTAIVLTRTRLDATLYVHYLSCFLYVANDCTVFVTGLWFLKLRAIFALRKFVLLIGYDSHLHEIPFYAIQFDVFTARYDRPFKCLHNNTVSLTYLLSNSNTCD